MLALFLPLALAHAALDAAAARPDAIVDLGTADGARLVGAQWRPERQRDLPLVRGRRGRGLPRQERLPRRRRRPLPPAGLQRLDARSRGQAHHRPARRAARDPRREARRDHRPRRPVRGQAPEQPQRPRLPVRRGLYFTDPPFGLPAVFDDPAKELPYSGVFFLKNGVLRLVSTDLRGPNGIALSPDENKKDCLAKGGKIVEAKNDMKDKK